MNRLTQLTLPAILICACGGEQLSQTWQLDRLRILGAKVTPAEPRPGEAVSFESLIFAPEGVELETVSWFSCLPVGANNFGCDLDPAILETLFEQFENLSEEELGQLFGMLFAVQGDIASLPDEPLYEPLKAAYYAGFSGFEPDFMLGWTAPEDALDGLSEREQKEGLSAITTLTAVPTNADNEDEFEIAYKRFPVSLADTPNHNPTMDILKVDGTMVNEVFYAESEKTYSISPVLSPDSVEDYDYVTPEGDIETRTEEPYFLWYTEGGSFDINFSLYPYSKVEWTAPKGPFEGIIISVIRDRRGGMDWEAIKVVVE
ncbi:MAG: hypothetical protein ACON4U_16470 [Myxococcota bacterium]